MNTHLVHSPYPLNRTVVFLPACSAAQPPGALWVWCPPQSHSAKCGYPFLCCLITQDETKDVTQHDNVKLKALTRKEVQSYFTLRMLKLCMCNVDKSKLWTERSCHVEVGLRLVDVLDSNRRENTLKCKPQFCICCLKCDFTHAFSSANLTNILA